MQKSRKEGTVDERTMRVPAPIKVIGVGGGGCNAVRRMLKKPTTGVQYIVCNTDIKSLDSCPTDILSVQIGEHLTRGFGAGGDTRVGEKAAEEGRFLVKRALKDLEARIRKFFEPLDLPFRDVVTPRQLYGIEKDEFAARLAHVVAWIGYLQWKHRNVVPLDDEELEFFTSQLIVGGKAGSEKGISHGRGTVLRCQNRTNVQQGGQLF